MWSGLSLLLANEAGGAIRRQIVGIALLATAGLVALVALVFALLALHGWLEVSWGAVPAYLLIAAGLAVVAAIIAIAGTITRRKRREATTMRSTALMAAPIAARVLAGRSNLGTLAVVAVIAAGALVGRQLAKD
jgi:hypothetical protein